MTRHSVRTIPSYGNYLQTRMGSVSTPYAFNKAQGRGWTMSEGQDGFGYYTRLTKTLFGLTLFSEKYYHGSYSEMREAFRRYVAVHH